MSPEVSILAARLFFVALATFMAIVLWSKTRDTAWMLMVIGIVAGYADILYSLLSLFGLAPEKGGLIFGAPILAYVFPNLPYVFFSLAFAVMLRRKRR